MDQKTLQKIMNIYSNNIIKNVLSAFKKTTKFTQRNLDFFSDLNNSANSSIICMQVTGHVPYTIHAEHLWSLTVSKASPKRPNGAQRVQSFPALLGAI